MSSVLEGVLSAWQIRESCVEVVERVRGKWPQCMTTYAFCQGALTTIAFQIRSLPLTTSEAPPPPGRLETLLDEYQGAVQADYALGLRDLEAGQRRLAMSRALREALREADRVLWRLMER
jgi:hypothetical protein